MKKEIDWYSVIGMGIIKVILLILCFLLVSICFAPEKKEFQNLPISELSTNAIQTLFEVQANYRVMETFQLKDNKGTINHVYSLTPMQ